MLKTFSTLLAFGLVIALPSAFATSTPLANGNSVTPGANSTTPGTTVYNSGVQTFNEGGGVSGTYQFVVDNVGGVLDFFYQISNTSTSDNFNEITLKTFTGVTTSVGYLTNPPFSGTATPSTADRDIGGDTINFHFLGPSGGTILPGMTSDWVEIDTNATSFNLNGVVGVVDGGTYNIPVGAPQPVTTPEPMSMTLLGGGLALLGLARWRRPGKKA